MPGYLDSQHIAFATLLTPCPFLHTSTPSRPHTLRASQRNGMETLHSGFWRARSRPHYPIFPKILQITWSLVCRQEMCEQMREKWRARGKELSGSGQLCVNTVCHRPPVLLSTDFLLGTMAAHLWSQDSRSWGRGSCVQGQPGCSTWEIVFKKIKE